MRQTGSQSWHPGVLSNDTDMDIDPLTAALVTPPIHGTLVLNNDGSFVYQPTANFNGLDSFVYKANDGAANSAAATVTITVNPVNMTHPSSSSRRTGSAGE